MRSLFICLLTSGIFLLSCKGKNQTVTYKDEDGTKTTVNMDPDEAQNFADEMDKKIEQLKSLTPLTIEQLKALVPEEFMGMKRSNFNAHSMMGYAMADAEYKRDDTSRLKITIMDCAGEAGSGMWGLSYWSRMNMERESDDGYTKTIDFKGGKAVEDYKKYSNDYTLTYTAGERFLVTVNGDNTGLDLVRQAANNLNLN